MSPFLRAVFLVMSAALLLGPRAGGADPQPKPKPSEPGPIIFQGDPAVQKQVEAAENFIQQKKWPEAFRTLQAILDAKDGATIEVKRKGRDGKEVVVWTNAQLEANRLLAALPARVRADYGDKYGPQARKLLDQAQAKKDAQLIAEVALRFRHTAAGREALRSLATAELERGDAFRAAALFGRLLDDRDAEWTPPLLFKAAVAFRKTGDTTRVERSWKQLRSRIGANRFRLGGRTLTLKQAQQELDKQAPVKAAELADWLVAGGDPSRNAQAQGGRPLLVPRWQVSTVDDPFEQDKDKRKQPEVAAWVKIALDQQTKLAQPVLPGFFPIAVQGQVVFRTYGGVAVVWINQVVDSTGDQHQAGELAWKWVCTGSVRGLLEDANYLATLKEWQNFYRQSFDNIIYANSAVGTLSSDGSRVYVVDDMAIPPHPYWLKQVLGWDPRKLTYPGKMKGLVVQNTLRAIDLDAGKLLWELPDRNNPGDFAESHFLGAPLPLGGKLYVLNEKKGELRLITLDAKKDRRGNLVVSKPVLCKVKDPVPTDISRRVQAVQLAYRDGVLVVPTHAGTVLGVDLLTQRLLWSYSYREEKANKPAPPPNPWGRPVLPAVRDPDADFPVARLVVADGKVVFAAPDSAGTHCLDLERGTPVWQRKRGKDGLYLAGVFGGKVLLVGKHSCQAMGLQDGKPLWQLDTGMPSGQGTAADGLYFLPLQRGEILAIDTDRGRIKSRVRSTNKQVVPGNLLFHQGSLISQTATGLTVFPLLEVRLREINAVLKQKPGDPAALTERAELLLGDGRAGAAVDDLRKALASKPGKALLPRIRRELYEAFGEFFQADFDTAAKKYLDEFKALCQTDSPAGTNSRLFRYYSLVGQGREKQGRLVEALRAYLAIADLDDNRLVTAPEDPKLKVRLRLWARGRITALLGKADAKQRKALEEEIQKQWQGLLGARERKG